MSGQFPIQFSKPLRRGKPFKMAPRPETPTTDCVEAGSSTWVTALCALVWYQGYMAGR